MSEEPKTIESEILKQVAPPPRARAPFWRTALDVLQLPVLAFVTALAVGGLIIILTDLGVLDAFKAALGKLASGGYERLALALAALAVGVWMWFDAERVLALLFRRLNPASPRAPTRWQTALVRAVAGLGGLLLAYALVRGAGFGEALDAAWNAVRTAYGAMAQGSLGSLPKIIAALKSGDVAARNDAIYPLTESLVAATPYIFAGLAVAVGFQCGLFNIGAEGQLFIGAICSVWVGFAVKGMPAIIHIPLALLAGAAGGALWALLPAILKAKVGAHEVINTIMMNYIAFRLSEWLLSDKGPLKRPDSANPVSPLIEKSAELPRFFPSPIRFHLGFFIALAVAALVYWFLYRTTLGFEVRTVGKNRNAARYAGMNITRNYIIAFCLSGALAGLAGANEVLGVNHNLALAFSSGYGFDSIALALLGNSHPGGVVLASLLFGTLRSGGTRMQNVAHIPVDIISIVQALVIAFIAAPAIIRAVFRIRVKRASDPLATQG